MDIMARKGAPIQIGRLGENETRRIVFSVGKVLADLPDATFTLLHKRPGDPAAYPIGAEWLEIIGPQLYWTVRSADVSVEGVGQCELIATVNGRIAKSEIYDTRIQTAMDGSGEPPEPWQDWVQDVIDASIEAKEAAEQGAVVIEKAEEVARNTELAEAAAEAAGESAENAELAADRAEQAASVAGYMFIEMVNGHLIYTKTSNVATDFRLENGHLIAEVS